MSGDMGSEHLESGPRLGHMCWPGTYGRDYSNCRASELNYKSAWPLFFLELSKILENNDLQ